MQTFAVSSILNVVPEEIERLRINASDLRAHRRWVDLDLAWPRASFSERLGLFVGKSITDMRRRTTANVHFLGRKPYMIFRPLQRFDGR